MKQKELDSEYPEYTTFVLTAPQYKKAYKPTSFRLKDGSLYQKRRVVWPSKKGTYRKPKQEKK